MPSAMVTLDYKALVPTVCVWKARNKEIKSFPWQSENLIFLPRIRRDRGEDTIAREETNLQSFSVSWLTRIII